MACSQVIEYVGEVVRSKVADAREVHYTKSGERMQRYDACCVTCRIQNSEE
eukprot:SAG31_NODE_1195_length_9445_cov_21.712711_7_plen_51_part_00